MTQNFRIRVSMNQAAVVKSGWVLKQGDFGMNFEIEVLNFDLSNTTPQIVFRKPMGAVEATSLTKAGNVYTYALRGTELDTPGKVICDLKLKNSTTQRISTASFSFEVVADTLDGLAEQASSYSDTIEQIVGGFDDEIESIEDSILSSRYDKFISNIPANADMNDYLTPGSYVAANGTIAASLANRPCDYAGRLFVISMASNNHKLQFYIDIMGNIYKRGWRLSAGFKEWTAEITLEQLTGNRSALNIDSDNILYSSECYHNRTGYYDPNQGGARPSSAYEYFVIPVTSGETYYIYKARFITTANARIEGTSVENYAYTATFTGDLYVSINKSDAMLVTKLTDYSNVRPFNAPSFTVGLLKQTTGDSQREPMSQAAVTQALQAVSGGSPLSGKKWTSCGDSFTEGDFSGLQPADYQFPDDPYQGQNMVYPFWIGRRTGCIITNEAKSGSTLAYIDGSRNEFSTPNGRYTRIAADADYITLYFGINDSHQNVPIGTINDNTNTTFYGAWNIVLEYLIRNHPSAKIGIIISNGCDTIDYPNATIEIAKKWGLAYFNMNGDPTIPLVFRVNGKPDLSQTVKDIRQNQYRVSASNGHPNVACHKDESTFIQAWLESI